MQMGENHAGVSLERIHRESATVLDNLFQLYAHDFSEHVPIAIEPSGRFGVTPGSEWWSREDHFAYLIKRQGALAGFALARAGSRVIEAPDVMDVAEFFILRGERRTGVGKSAAHALFAEFPRAWEVRVRQTNVPALLFWSRAAETWVGRHAEITPCSVDGVAWNVLRFARPNERVCVPSALRR
jgi:predicted acetyltransferase